MAGIIRVFVRKSRAGPGWQLSGGPWPNASKSRFTENSYAHKLCALLGKEILMLPSYDLNAPKRAANLRINEDLLNKAKSLDINLSATLEKALAQALKEKQREQWLAENRQAIAAYNEHVDTNGVFSDELRSF